MHPDDVIFYLWTKNPSTSEILGPFAMNDAVEFQRSNFDPRKETIFITHGWVSSEKSEACQSVLKGTIFCFIHIGLRICSYTFNERNRQKLGSVLVSTSNRQSEDPCFNSRPGSDFFVEN